MTGDAGTGWLAGAGVVGVLRAATPEQALGAARAAVRGGLRAIEVTMTVPDAPEVLRTLRAELGPTVHLGAGTVLTLAQARQAQAAGATFLVSPHLGEDLLAWAREAQLAYLPGVLTPGEIARALGLGAAAVKVFPVGALGGPAYLRDLAGPFPELAVLATGRIAPDEVGAYLQAGARAVGLGSQLFPAPALASGDWAAVEGAVRSALQTARGAVPA